MVQFRTRRYVPGVYWLTVVLISVVGTLVTDNLTDGLGVPLVTSTIVFAVALAVTFAAWYAQRAHLSIHTSSPAGARPSTGWRSCSPSRWAPQPATSSTSSSASATGRRRCSSRRSSPPSPSATWSSGPAPSRFWIAYILTRPLGASLGDGFSQARSDGGLGLGTTVTSVGFSPVILAVVTYLAVTRRDQRPPSHCTPMRSAP